MSQDKYGNFTELRLNHREGSDYKIRLVQRELLVGIVALHGGKIEPLTSEIAKALAMNSYSLYCFEGLRLGSFRDLHITSTKFDEPRGMKLISGCDIVVAIHGMRGREEKVALGGLDLELAQSIKAKLREADFDANASPAGLAGINANNICNRGRRRKGVQLEISKGLRCRLAQNEAALTTFTQAVRSSIQKLLL